MALPFSPHLLWSSPVQSLEIWWNVQLWRSGPPEPQILHNHTLSNPCHRTQKSSMLFERSSKTSKNIPNLSTKDTGTTGLTSLLALWFLLFDIFAILFRIFALQQVTQLNMQQPKKPTVKTEETTNGLLCAHVGWKGTITKKYNHYKMVEPEPPVLHTSILIHLLWSSPVQRLEVWWNVQLWKSGPWAPNAP